MFAPVPVRCFSITFIDSHCHLEAHGNRDRGSSQVKADLSLGKTHLQFCISNFVFPWRWSKIEVLLSAPLVKKPIRVHSHAEETNWVHPHAVEP